ncbi:hypothetical protein EB151_03630 [archaeon]|nr:hypothetical protein [archaeon]
MKNFSQIYVNGSSLSCGGSLHWKSTAWRFYTTEQDVKSWKNSKDVSYGNVLGKMLGISVINEAKEGGGLDRLIRKTYDFISTSTLEELSETLFIFDIPLQPARFEVFSRKHNDWFTVAVSYKGGEDPNLYQTIEVSRDEIKWESILSFSRAFGEPKLNLSFEEMEEHDKLLTKIVQYYHDYEIEANRLLRELTMFYCFLDKMKINYFRDNNETIFAGSINFAKRNDTNELIKKLKLFETSNENVIGCPTIWNLSEKKKWRISDETPIEDAHLGYFGNKKYAEYLYEKLK